MSDDYDEKLDKKRRKAEYKLEKKRLEHEYEQKKKELEKAKNVKRKTSTTDDDEKVKAPEPRAPGPEKDETLWYKDPNWIRAITSLIVMVIVLLTFYMTFIR